MKLRNLRSVKDLKIANIYINKNGCPKTYTFGTVHINASIISFFEIFAKKSQKFSIIELYHDSGPLSTFFTDVIVICRQNHGQRKE